MARGSLHRPVRLLTGDLESRRHYLLGRCLRSGLIVELPLSLLVKHAIASGAATAHVHPVAWDDDDRPWAEIPGRCRVRPDVQDAADDHVLDPAAVCVPR